MDTLIKVIVTFALLAVVITSIFVTFPYFSDYLYSLKTVGNSIDSKILPFVNNCGSYFYTARGLINNFLPADLVNIVLIGTITYPLLKAFWTFSTWLYNLIF